jgi:hypothetical protein
MSEQNWNSCTVLKIPQQCVPRSRFKVSPEIISVPGRGGSACFIVGERDKLVRKAGVDLGSFS